MKHLRPFSLNENFDAPHPGAENERRARAAAYAYGGYRLSNASVTAAELRALIYARFPGKVGFVTPVYCEVDVLHNTVEIQVDDTEVAVQIHKLMESEPVRAYKDDDNERQDDDYAYLTSMKYY